MRTPEFDRNADIVRLRIPPALKEWAESCAREQGVTLSRYVRTLIVADREEYIDQLQKSWGMEHLQKFPASVPPGKVLVHNHIQPARRAGTRGFRYWLADPSDKVERCPCGWAPELGEHYRVHAVWSKA
jgi:hypothetical protein